MPLVNFSNVDFDQIKISIQDYLKANSNFTDYDFTGSNLSTIIDTLAYNTYITSYNANMVTNEVFIDSATLRENVVSLARNIGYVPRSKTAAVAQIKINDIDVGTTSDATTKFLTLRSGLVCVGNADSTTYRFSISDPITSTRVEDRGGTSFAVFDDPINVYEGTLLQRVYRVDSSQDQRYIICLLYTSPSPRDRTRSRMPSSA